MYTKDINQHKEQDKGREVFQFTPDNMLKVQMHIAKYPKEREASAILPLLHLAQHQNGGWLSISALEEIARLLNMPYMRVYEVVTFYKMFFFAPTGKYNLQLCGTTPCMLRGAAQLKEACQRKLKINTGEVSPDGFFSLVEVECVGACVHAPVVQINNELFENLTIPQMESIIDGLAQGESLEAIYEQYACLPSLPSSLLGNNKIEENSLASSSKASPLKKTKNSSEES